MTTIEDFRTQLREDYLKDPNGKVRNNSMVDRAINKAYDQVQVDLNYWSNENLWATTYSTTAGDYEYDLPSDFARIKLVRYMRNGTNKYPLGRTTLKILQSTFTEFTQWQPTQYYKNGLTLWVYPIPPSAGTIYLEYYTMLPRISESQDSETPPEYDDTIILYAAYKLLSGVEKYDKLKEMKAQYDDDIAKLRLQYEYDDENMRFLNERRNGGTTRATVYSDNGTYPWGYRGGWWG